MKVFKFLIIPAFLYCGTALASDWQSPVEAEFQESAPAVFAEFSRARAILDNYQGRNADLTMAYEILDRIDTNNEPLAPVMVEFGRLFIMASHIGGGVDEETLNRGGSAIFQAIKLRPEYENAYVLLGHYSEITGNYKAALEYLNEAEALGSLSPWLKLNLASVHIDIGNYDKASIAVQEVIDSNTSNRKALVAAYSNKIAIAWATKGLSDVKRAHEEFIAKFPDRAWSWGNYASFLLFSYLEPEEAVAAADRALKLMDYGKARVVKGVAMYTLWAQAAADPLRQQEAEMLYKEANTFYPHHDQILKMAGRNHWTKDTATALEAHLQSEQ